MLVLCNKGCCLPWEAFGLQSYKWFGPAWWGCGHESQASREGWVTRDLQLTQITVLALATGKCQNILKNNNNWLNTEVLGEILKERNKTQHPHSEDAKPNVRLKHSYIQGRWL